MDYYSEDYLLIRSLTDESVFCPKCGTKNYFKLGRDGSELRYFCERCSERLNDYWKSAQTGQLTLVKCDSCQQPTFGKLKYCVSCGTIQRRVAHKRAKEISKTLGDSQLKEDIRKSPLGLGMFKSRSRRILFIIIIVSVACVLGVVLSLLIFYWSLGF